MDEVLKWLGVANTPVIRSIVFLSIASALIILVGRVFRQAIRNRVGDTDVRYRASKFISIATYALVVFVALTEIGGRISGLTVAIGAASAGIAFALQEVIASYAGWLTIISGGFYKVGDRVQLGGIKGDVIDIGFVRTTLMEIGGWVDGDLYNGRIVRVANSFVFKEPVFNYSGEFPFVWDEIVIPIKYGSDYDAARKILEDTASEIVGDYADSAHEQWKELVKSYRIENARVQPLVTMIANDNWVAFTLRYVVDHRARRLTKDKLFSHVLSAVESSNGRVAMASMTVQLVEAPALHVKVSNEHTS